MDVSKKKIPVGVIGIGMVGTPLARYFTEIKGYRRGHDLFLYDIDPARGLFDDISQAAVIFVSVPTPRSPSGAADLSAVESAFGMLSGEPPALGAGEPRPVGDRGGKIVVIKSTVPPGTTEDFQKRHPRHKVLFNPEFLTARMAWEDFVKPDRQIVGFTRESLDAAHLVLSLLPKAPFMSPWGQGTYEHTAIGATEAEIIKYAGNVHFARKINFANALARLAEAHGVDYENVRLGMAADHRIGGSHIDVTHGGYRGFGGFCLPKDLDALIIHLEEIGLADCAGLLRRDREFNANLLASQGLAVEDVSARDHQERVRQKTRPLEIKE